MNRLYVVEPTPSVTCAAADHRLPLRASIVALFARALAGKLALGGLATPPAKSGEWLAAVVKDLQAHRGASLVIAGEYQPAEVHALAHAINAALGNVGASLYYTEPVEAEPCNHLESLRALCADMDAGRVDALILLGGNPVYDAPHDFDFAVELKKVRVAIHLSPYVDETSDCCQWHVPAAHFLESWSDARAFDGTASIVQPLIAPLYQGRTAHDVIGTFSEKSGLSSYDRVRETWKTLDLGGGFEKSWRKVLNDGVIWNTTFAPMNLSMKWSPANLPPVTPSPADQLEFKLVRRRRRHGGKIRRTPFHREIHRRKCGVPDDAIVQHLAPGLLEATAKIKRFPGLTHAVVAGKPGFFAESADHVVRRLALIERCDQRLDDAGRAVGRARVAPRFEEIRCGDVPLATVRRLVHIGTQVDRDANFFQLRRKIKIMRSVVDGIATEENQRVHAARVHVRAERA